jgi:hypothetical protein
MAFWSASIAFTIGRVKIETGKTFYTMCKIGTPTAETRTTSAFVSPGRLRIVKE